MPLQQQAGDPGTARDKQLVAHTYKHQGRHTRCVGQRSNIGKLPTLTTLNKLANAWLIHGGSCQPKLRAPVV